MQYEFNQIIMASGKSRIIEKLIVGKTIVVLIGCDYSHLYLPDKCYYVKYKNFHSLVNNEYGLFLLNNYDTIVFYSNEVKSKSMRYVEHISRFVDLNKCTFMFNSEM